MLFLTAFLFPFWYSYNTGIIFWKPKAGNNVGQANNTAENVGVAFNKYLAVKNLSIINIEIIKNKTGGHWVKYNLQIFINISIITSFICCGLSLLHYIKDIFQRIKIKISNTIGVVTSLLPPYFFSILYPNGFILALQYASIFAVIVFVYTPMLLCNKKLFSTKNLYPLILGTLVIIAQVLNLLPAA